MDHREEKKEDRVEEEVWVVERTKGQNYKRHKRNGSEEENSSKRIRRLWKWFGASV